MPEAHVDMDRLAHRVRAALETSDLTTFAALIVFTSAAATARLGAAQRTLR